MLREILVQLFVAARQMMHIKNLSIVTQDLEEEGTINTMGLKVKISHFKIMLSEKLT